MKTRYVPRVADLKNRPGAPARTRYYTGSKVLPSEKALSQSDQSRNEPRLDVAKPLYFRLTRKGCLREPSVAIYGLAQAAQATGDRDTAKQRYQEFLLLWKNAHSDRPELAVANEFWQCINSRAG